MSKKDDALGRLIRENFDAIEPPSAVITEIRRRGHSIRRETNFRRRRMAWLAAAVALVFGCFFPIQYYQNTQRNEVRSNLASQISAVHRHHPQGKYEFESVDFASLEANLERIGFSFADAEEQVRKRFDLRGCSYCKVIADLAIHFNARERETGRLGSFYIAELTPELASISPSRREDKGVDLEFWDDGERFFIFASNVSL